MCWALGNGMMIRKRMVVYRFWAETLARQSLAFGELPMKSWMVQFTIWFRGSWADLASSGKILGRRSLDHSWGAVKSEFVGLWAWHLSWIPFLPSLIGASAFRQPLSLRLESFISSISSVRLSPQGGHMVNNSSVSFGLLSNKFPSRYSGVSIPQDPTMSSFMSA